jgi:hypothetical protein
LPCPLQSSKKQNSAKTLAPSAFLRDRKNIARIVCAGAPCTLSCALPALFETQDVESLRARWCFIVQKRWFFYRAVVMPMQCARSPRALDDIATHSWLGGQHGEEAKEDGEGSEKGREEDQAPEEEVSARRASVFDFERRR